MVFPTELKNNYDKQFMGIGFCKSLFAQELLVRVRLKCKGPIRTQMCSRVGSQEGGKEESEKPKETPG